MHERDVGGDGLPEDETERRPEQQRSAQRRAGSEARERRPVKAG